MLLCLCMIYQEDIVIAHSLGVKAYRFSISWARILPRGRFGEVNPSGIKFYNKIIDSLLLKGIEPFVTIHHFDHPQELEDRYGSWLSPLMQEDFVLLAETCFKSFGDRVKYWTTINEVNQFAEMAYVRGVFPPAHCSAPFGNCSVGNSDVEPFIVVHNMLLSHAKAVNLYREQFQQKQGGSIGLIAHSHMYEPLRDGESDRLAVNRALAFTLGWAIDPLVFGDYPPEMRQYHVSGDHFIRGFAYTTGERDGILIGEPTGVERFYVVPRGIEKIVDYVSKRYNNMPIYVTENGYSPPRTEQVPDLLHDVNRIKFHEGYLAALARAIRNGADVRGYFVWSLMDNFEWTGGYSTTFGLYYIDRQTLKRTPKLSAKWYEDFIANRSKGSNREGFKNGKEGSKRFPKSKTVITSRAEAKATEK
ncbi:beta-glucosidase 18-like [Durio zibethinus]|uniref:Beta-glucosidase 18-like n=1 Tax=Durio zibethinus TaxID=66656 RepID=A0A6P5ZMC9_DURZI|nr:beta-glucosidase 18-like [Durio zibethinus]